MKISSWAAIVALVATVGAVGCASDSPDPVAAPTSLSPIIKSQLVSQSVAGLWSGPATLISVTGGTGAVADAGIRACVGDAIDGSGGVNASVLVIQQDGTALTGRLTSADTGLAGNYSGTKGESQLVLDANSWDNGTLNMVCPTSDEVMVTLVGSSIVAEFERVAAPSTLTGTMAHTFNVVYGLEEEGHIEGVVTKFSFTMARR